jgi:polyferredoxin
MTRRKASWLVWLRRFSQTVFVLLFFAVFLEAEYRPVNQTGHHVKLFFLLDPLILISSWLASHTIASGLLLSLGTVLLTVLFGRWFCGWVCPFGALHNLLSSWRVQSRKEKIETGGYSPWQKTKYYLLVAFLVAALFGLNLVGWLDPFSLLYRSTATVLYPAFSDGLKSLFGWIYQADPGIGRFKVTALSEPAYEFLRRTLLPATQPYFYGIVLIAILFFATLFLNLYRARFWCRYICPLGALLGVAGKNPLVQIERSNELCNHCGLCVANCQGAANPNDAQKWKPSECFYCLNCHSECPKKTVTFAIHLARGAK